jgi:hypothetical protein
MFPLEAHRGKCQETHEPAISVRLRSCDGNGEGQEPLLRHSGTSVDQGVAGQAVSIRRGLRDRDRPTSRASHYNPGSDGLAARRIA